MRIIIIVLFSFLLIACETMHQTGAHGKSIDEVIAKYGMPETIMPASQGNTLYVYTFRTYETIPSQVSPNPTLFVGPKGKSFSAYIPSANSTKVPVVRCTRVFEVNKSRMIVREESRGAGCM